MMTSHCLPRSTGHGKDVFLSPQARDYGRTRRRPGVPRVSPGSTPDLRASVSSRRGSRRFGEESSPSLWVFSHVNVARDDRDPPRAASRVRAAFEHAARLETSDPSCPTSRPHGFQPQPDRRHPPPSRFAVRLGLPAGARPPLRCGAPRARTT